MLPAPSGYSLRLTAAVPCVVAAATVSARAVQSSDDSQWIGKETVMRCLKVLFMHISVVTEEN